jgi:hypothetical protein
MKMDPLTGDGIEGMSQRELELSPGEMIDPVLE